MFKELIIIRKLLVVIVIFLLLYLLHILSIIFIPLIFGLFLALLFSPFMRWINKNKIPPFFGILGVIIIVGIIFIGTYKIIELTSHELTQIDEVFIENMENQLNEVAKPITGFLNINLQEGQSELSAVLKNERVISNLYENIGSGINMAKNFLVTFLMALFFMLLFLMGSTNIKKALEQIAFKEIQNPAGVYRQIEKDVFGFITVKTLMSLLTGLAIGITCYFFDVSFPIFWGVLGFLFNFIQLIGSVLVVLILSIFALVELNLTGTFLAFTILIIALQALIGGVLEPILLGKTFSINTITILIMLSVWSLIWGIPGLVLAVPITVLLKNILEKSSKTVILAKMMS